MLTSANAEIRNNWVGVHPEYQIKSSILLLLQHCTTVLEKLENISKKEDMCVLSLQTERINNYPSMFNISTFHLGLIMLLLLSKKLY